MWNPNRPPTRRKTTANEHRQVSGTQHKPPPPCTIVIFGANGDLTRRLVVPALYNLSRSGLLPERMARGWMTLASQPALRIIGLLFIWNGFGLLFHPVHLEAVRLIFLASQP